MIQGEALEEALLLERFERYLAWAGGDRARALELCALNTRVSEALYTPLRMLEVALRNRVHAVLSAARGPRWFEDDGLLAVPHQAGQVAEVLADLAREGKEPSPGRVVAALTFSFWTAMLSPAYETLWQTTLHRIARRGDGKGLRRKNLSGPLTPIRVLRNRPPRAARPGVEPAQAPRRHAPHHRITGWLSPAAAAWCRTMDRFDQVHPPGRITLQEAPGEPQTGAPPDRTSPRDQT